jgi:GNAT superfamily N-acetyltransferase
MILRPLSDFPLTDVVDLWNEAFQDYAIPMQQTVDHLFARMARDGLSPSLSVIATIDDRPVGLVLNGIRTIRGMRIAWNGGTGVIPSFRRSGVGKAMIRYCLELYRREGAHIATLEAIADNQKAIDLYRQCGYEVVNRIGVFLQQSPANPNGETLQTNWNIQQVPTIEIPSLPFYQRQAPWQTHWENLQAGESLIACDENRNPVGYALFQRVYAEDGQCQEIVMYQCEANPDHPLRDEITIALAHHVFRPDLLNIKRKAVHVPLSRSTLCDWLEKNGFQSIVEQVQMRKELR